DRMLLRLASMLVGTASPVRVFVLDEPTAALTHAESDRLFHVIGELARGGAAILYVSHRIDEVLALAQRVTVLRDGKVVHSASIAETSRATMIRAMTGRDVAESHPRRHPPPRPTIVCRLEDVASGRLSGLRFDLRAGEVLGVVGLENAGQSDLLHLLLGDSARATGRAEVVGRPLARSPFEAWRGGIALVPRERRKEGLMLGRAITANTVLPHLARLSRHGLACARREEAETGRVAERLRLRFQRLSQPVRTLSGGNQQKVVLGRAILADPRLLLLDEPTRGVDVGARQDIYSALRTLAADGCAIVMASTDLPEVLGLADRILVLRNGRQAALVDAAGLSPSALLSHIYGNEPPVPAT
ncbi:MAG TPA: ATP-binding cassette domain-containing protein, partial [Rubellimicrobium sp.]|nr:ATP-binding cassette domain-containing protein [Rubellimicrobium sp.]